MSTNLLANGDFSKGAVGFATGYDKGDNSLVPADSYVVGTDPHKYHFAGADFGDHTTGSGKMLIINGSPLAATTVWRESVNVVKGVAYDFNGWAASWATNGIAGGDISPAQVQVTIDGKVISATTLPTNTGQWTSLANSWLATSSRATITITDLNTSVSGNDSAYDDFSFSALASIHGSVVTAAVSTKGKVSAKHKPLADVTLYLDTNNDGTFDSDEPIAITNKAGVYVFTGLIAGTYQVIQVNPPSYNLPPVQLTINVMAGKQLAHENLMDLYTAVVPTVSVFR